MNRILLPLPVMLTLTLLLAGCDEKAKLSPDQQTGPDPLMPKAQDYLMPPMQVPSGVGWKAGARPDVAEGLHIEKMADGFLHPRMVYVLPNDDVLVVESNSPGEEPLTTPKQLIAGIVKISPAKAVKAVTALPCYAKAAAAGRNMFSSNICTPRSAYSLLATICT